MLTRPGNAYVYFNSHEFDRTGNNEFFSKTAAATRLGGQYGNIVTKLLDIRNSYGRGNFRSDGSTAAGFSNIYATSAKLDDRGSTPPSDRSPTSTSGTINS